MSNRAVWLQCALTGLAVATAAAVPAQAQQKNGNITLEGVVGNQMDKTIAEMAARSVSDAFSVTDNLKIG